MKEDSNGARNTNPNDETYQKSDGAHNTNLTIK